MCRLPAPDQLPTRNDLSAGETLLGVTFRP